MRNKILFIPPYLGTRLISKMLAIMLSVFVFERAAIAQVVNVPGPVTNLSALIAPNGPLNVAVQTNTTINLCGTLNIDVSAYDFQDCVFNLCPGAQIVVLPERRLTLSGTLVRGEPNGTDLWHRILVRGTARLNCRPTGTSNTEIRDAQFGIELEHQARLSVDRTLFENNWIGIFTRRNAAPNESALNKNVDVFEFNGNRFRQTAPLRGHTNWANDDVQISNASASVFSPNQRAFAGVCGWNTYLILLTSDQTQPLPNIFENMDNGIVSNIGLLEVENAEFFNIRYFSFGTAPNDNLVNNTRGMAVFSDGAGVVGTKVALLSRLHPSGTHLRVNMESVSTGLRAQRTRDIFVQNARITNVPTAALPGGITVNLATFGTAINLGPNNFVSGSGSLQVLASRIENAERLGINLANIANSQQIRVEDNFVQVNASNNINRGGIIMNTLAGSPNPFLASIKRDTVTIGGGMHGIRATNSSNLWISENIVHMNNLATTAAINGIEAEASNDCFVTCNSVTGNTPAPNGANPKAAVRIAAINNGRVSCNTSNDFQYGIFAQSQTNNIPLKGNTMENHDVGLFLDNSAIGPQPHHGNLWTGTYLTVGASNSGIGTLSPFEVNQTVAPILPPGVTLGPWFQVTPGTPYECPRIGSSSALDCATIADLRPEELGAGDYLAATGDIPFENYTEPLNAQVDRGLLDKLEAYPELAPEGSIMDAFRDAQLATEEGNLAAVARETDTLNRTEPALRAALGELHAQLGAHNDEVRTLSLAAANAANDEAAQNALLQQLGLARQNVQNLLAQMAALESALSAFAQTEIQALAAQNSSTAPNEIWAANEKTVNELRLLVAQTGEADFSAAQLQALYNIAEQCPIIGGPSVYRARSLYALAGQDETFVDNCPPTAQQRAAETADAPAKALLLPNPATTEFALRLAEAPTENLAVEIFDALGNRALATELMPGQPLLIVHTHQLPAGAYWVRASSASGQIFAGRIAIIK